MPDILNRAVVSTDRGPTHAPTTGAVPAASASMVMTAMRAHQGRGNSALYLADRILQQARATRTDVAPDMEGGDATVGDGSPEQEMEPLDPTIEAARQMDDEEEPTNDDLMPEEEQESVEVIAIEVDTGDEEEVPAEEMSA